MRRLLSLVVLALALAHSAAHADVIVPGILAGTEGNSSNNFPFNLGQTLVVSQRYQQVYASSEFADPITITGLFFRPDALGGSAFDTVLPDMQIDLSTTLNGPDALSATFATNVGADNTIVFARGPLPLSSANTGPADGPKDFDIFVPLSTSFFYDPTLGNLLMDVRNFGRGTTTSFDAHTTGIGPAGDSISRRFSTDVDNASGLNVDTLGLVTKFQTQAPAQPVPAPASLALFGAAGAWLVGRALIRRRRRS